ncbi:MAG: hypothetical protein K2Y02_06530 [Burkholderiaceae bacterium]|nr:hypothetical protein [Burkholderiaceae bacterium]
MNIILSIATFAAAYLIAARIIGLPPFQGRVDFDGRVPHGSDPRKSRMLGRVDDAAADSIWYEATNPFQIRHVQGAWDRRMKAIVAEGRLFMVPGHGGCTTWEDLDAWEILANKMGLRFKRHYLRIVHSHWRHDMDNDAIAMEFESPQERAAFVRAIPADGPERRNIRALLGDGAGELDRLLLANRIRSSTETA